MLNFNEFNYFCCRITGRFFLWSRLSRIKTLLNMIELTLDYPPSVNHLYIHGTTRKIKTAEAKAWEEKAYYEIKQQMRKQTLCDTSETIIVELLRKDGHITDYDNPLKEINDILKIAHLIKDDSQLDCAIILKGRSDNGKNYIKIGLVHGDWGLLQIYKNQPEPKKSVKKK